MIISFLPGTVEFVRMTDTKKPKKFVLSADEANAFCEAWTAYQADLQAKREAEEQRRLQVLAKALAIAKQYPAITIEEQPGYGYNGETAWRVSVPEIGFVYRSCAYSPDDLLSQAQEALNVYLQECERRAFDIASKHTDITITTFPENESGPKWEVSCEPLGETFQYIAYDADKLLQYVKECQEKLQERNQSLAQEKVAQ